MYCTICDLSSPQVLVFTLRNKFTVKENLARNVSHQREVRGRSQVKKKCVHLKNGEILPPSNSAKRVNDTKTENFPFGYGGVVGEASGGRRQT